MSVLATKPAPLALGTRDADGGSNRVELLPRKNPMVTQLLDDFVNYGAPPKTAARATPPHAAQAAAPAPAPQPSELAQLRVRVVQLETRLRALETKASQPSQDMNERVVAVLEQLIAELRERA